VITVCVTNKTFDSNITVIINKITKPHASSEHFTIANYEQPVLVSSTFHLFTVLV